MLAGPCLRLCGIFCIRRNEVKYHFWSFDRAVFFLLGLMLHTQPSLPFPSHPMKWCTLSAGRHQYLQFSLHGLGIWPWKSLVPFCYSKTVFTKTSFTVQFWNIQWITTHLLSSPVWCPEYDELKDASQAGCRQLQWLLSINPPHLLPNWADVSEDQLNFNKFGRAQYLFQVRIVWFYHVSLCWLFLYF